MLERAQSEVALLGTSVLQWFCADARDVARLLPGPLDYVLMANTLHGVPDRLGLARAVRSVLRPRGLFAVVNWHRMPREQTLVLDRPRGPPTEMRLLPEATAAAIEPAGLRLVRVIDLPPYHYGALFEAPT